jgi:hypothetical protein
VRDRERASSPIDEWMVGSRRDEVSCGGVGGPRGIERHMGLRPMTMILELVRNSSNGASCSSAARSASNR